MKKTIALLLSAVLLFFTFSSAFAAGTGTVYYIDSVNGSDSNTGTSPTEAWKTLSKASGNTYAPGDSILLKCGQSYPGVFTANGSGSENSPVTLSSYGEGSKPVLTGAGDSNIIVVGSVSNWIVENLELTSPGGRGVAILAYSGVNTENILLRSCVIHDLEKDSRKTRFCAVELNNDSGTARLKNIHLDSLTIYNVSWGIHSSGLTTEDTGKYNSNTPNEYYNSDYLFENLYIENATYGGIVVGAVQDCMVRNCRILNCATATVGAYAPVWTRHSNRVTIEYCEVAGSTNPQDGMTIDFDGWTTNSTYRYIYSHNNNRFMRNCVYDSVSKNSGNSVYNCISVNDKTSINYGASSLVSAHAPSVAKMSNFSFHDNVIVSSKPIIWTGVSSCSSYNNSYSGGGFYNFIQKILNMFSGVGGFSYSVDNDYVNEQIALITENLPNK